MMTVWVIKSRIIIKLPTHLVTGIVSISLYAVMNETYKYPRIHLWIFDGFSLCNAVIIITGLWNFTRLNVMCVCRPWVIIFEIVHGKTWCFFLLSAMTLIKRLLLCTRGFPPKHNWHANESIGASLSGICVFTYICCAWLIIWLRAASACCKPAHLQQVSSRFRCVFCAYMCACVLYQLNCFYPVPHKALHREPLLDDGTQ